MGQFHSRSVFCTVKERPAVGGKKGSTYHHCPRTPAGLWMNPTGGALGALHGLPATFGTRLIPRCWSESWGWINTQYSIDQLRQYCISGCQLLTNSTWYKPVQQHAVRSCCRTTQGTVTLRDFAQIWLCLCLVLEPVCKLLNVCFASSIIPIIYIMANAWLERVISPLQAYFLHILVIRITSVLVSYLCRR